MRTRLILTIIGLGAVDLGLVIAVVAVVAHRSGRDEVRRAEATDADMRYSGPEIEKSTVVFRDASESVAESADRSAAAVAPSPVIRYSDARNSVPTSEPPPNADGVGHRLRPPEGLSLRPALPDDSSLAEAALADAPLPTIIVVSPPLDVTPRAATARSREPTPDAPPATDRREPGHDHDCLVPSRYPPPTDATGERGGSGGWGLDHHSSTLEEGVSHGYADMIRSTGECRYLNSVARCNQQEEYCRALENRKMAVATYFELARINREERARQRGPRPTCEQLRRYARQAAPQRLTSQEFDSACGTLAWPGLLQGPQFAAERSAIDRLMTERSSKNGGHASESARNVRRLVERLRMGLKQQIEMLHPTEYVAAQRFLAGIEYEVYPRGPDIAASARLATLAAK